MRKPFEHYKHVPIESDKTETYFAGIGIVCATKGDLVKAKEYLAKAIKADQNFYVASEENAEVIIPIYLGDFDRAFDEIQKDIVSNKYYLNFYKENPAFKLLLNDVRYEIFDTIFKTKGTTMEFEAENSSDRSSHTEKSLLEESEIEVYQNQLLQFMVDESPYLHADLSLRSLANQLNLLPNKLSWLLNNCIGKNFNEFINHYRIEAFKSLAKDPANANITVLGLAYDSGFNSKTVFNTYFKKETGLTPKEFLKGK